MTVRNFPWMPIKMTIYERIKSLFLFWNFKMRNSMSMLSNLYGKSDKSTSSVCLSLTIFTRSTTKIGFSNQDSTLGLFLIAWRETVKCIQMNCSKAKCQIFWLIKTSVPFLQRITKCRNRVRFWNFFMKLFFEISCNDSFGFRLILFLCNFCIKGVQ